MSKRIAAQGVTSQDLECCDGLGPITMSQKAHFSKLFILVSRMVHAGGDMAHGVLGQHHLLR